MGINRSEETSVDYFNNLISVTHISVLEFRKSCKTVGSLGRRFLSTFSGTAMQRDYNEVKLAVSNLQNSHKKFVMKVNNFNKDTSVNLNDYVGSYRNYLDCILSFATVMLESYHMLMDVRKTKNIELTDKKLTDLRNLLYSIDKDCIRKMEEFKNLAKQFEYTLPSNSGDKLEA